MHTTYHKYCAGLGNDELLKYQQVLLKTSEEQVMPGHIHLINGLYDGHRLGASLLAIPSSIPSHEFGTKYFQ